MSVGNPDGGSRQLLVPVCLCYVDVFGGGLKGRGLQISFPGHSLQVLERLGGTYVRTITVL